MKMPVRLFALFSSPPVEHPDRHQRGDRDSEDDPYAADHGAQDLGGEDLLIEAHLKALRIRHFE